MTDTEPPTALIQRLLAATNAHDVEAVVACFSTSYRNETPAHPARSFDGPDQVRRNWEQIFAFVPDLTADVLRVAVDGDTVWSEWEHRGTRADGSAHLLRGVVILGVTDSMADWARFYLEPVDTDDSDINAAVQRQVATGGRRSAP
jgi:ketosteroid isomerase-like protein